ncbi:uncharacterized protein LOC130377618 [Gadus chalcogrammus]|uniref:uncharacterized protein LOC130377618 n=1 Tax=Gadus chalcogrammus TaxID=1042646 RepID=UPI0024C49369|nr:uncharacterized protein LOC130377618 [Gadus chalcogrammus]
MQSQIKYKQGLQTDLSSTLYSGLPETIQTQLAKEITDLQSQVKYKEGGKAESSTPLYHHLPETIDTSSPSRCQRSRASCSTRRTMTTCPAPSTLCSQRHWRPSLLRRWLSHTVRVHPLGYGILFHLRQLHLNHANYKAAVKEQSGSSLYSKLPETLETQRVKEVTQLQSENRYKEEGEKRGGFPYAHPDTAETQGRRVTEIQRGSQYSLLVPTSVTSALTWQQLGTSSTRWAANLASQPVHPELDRVSG